MVWRHSESFLLLLLTILTNHRGLLQESKCTFSSTWNVIIDIKVALAKGLKSPAPFHTDTVEECHDRCCTDLPVTGESRCNFMTFNPRQKNSFPNCYLFYCPTEDACPLIESTGYISHFVQRDSESMENESMEEELSDKGIPLDQLRNLTSNLTSTKITTRQPTTVTTLQTTTVESRTSSTHTKFYTLPVTTKPLTMTRTPSITLAANPLVTALSLTTDEPKIIHPTIHTTSTSAFLTNLLLTTIQLTSTNYHTTLSATTMQPTATSTLPTTLPVTTTPTTTTTTQTTMTTTLPTTLPVTTTRTTTTTPTTTTTTLPVTTLTKTTTTLPDTTTPTTTTTTRTTTTTLPVTSTQTITTTTLADTTTQKRTTIPLTTTTLPNIQLTTTHASTAKVTPKMTQQFPTSKIPVAKTPFIGIITVLSSKGRNKLLGSHVKSSGKMEDSKVEVQSGLIAALLFGLLFLIIVMIVISKRISESYNRRHYTRMDYLINGMYIDA